MTAYNLEILATPENFDEEAYLNANPDVAKVVAQGQLKSGRLHFDTWGKNEGRTLRLPASSIAQAKQNKLNKIKPLLRHDLACTITPTCYNYLSEHLRAAFNIIDTEAVSGNGYDENVMHLVNENQDGWVLDCGAGRRPVYFENVVNFEIADYETTDVRGVGEALPFINDAFDAVISIAVLEHVKDPFLCAQEIARVLKPGGKLVCCVPFLQPLHGYPHHYYNMTSQGIENLFSDYLTIDNIEVVESVLPIWSLTWILRSWADGLTGQTRQDFLKMSVADLINSADKYLHMPFVKELSTQKNIELASATVLHAHK